MLACSSLRLPVNNYSGRHATANHWGAQRHLHGFNAGGHLYPRYVLHRGAHSLCGGRDHLGIFAGIYFWFPKMFGRMMGEKLGKIHFWRTFVFFNLTFFPMHFLGVGGHMRRI